MSGTPSANPTGSSPFSATQANFGSSSGFKFLGHKLNLRFCEWHKAPVLFPCLVVNFTEPSAFIPKICEIRWTKSDRAHACEREPRAVAIASPLLTDRQTTTRTNPSLL